MISYFFFTVSRKFARLAYLLCSMHYNAANVNLDETSYTFYFVLYLHDWTPKFNAFY